MIASIVIPTCDKPEHLKLSLSGLVKQTVPFQDFEVIIVNDGTKSVNDPVETVSRLGTEMRIKVIEREEKGNRSAARNRGLREALGEICIFMDDDMIPYETFVAGHLKAFKNGFQMVKGSPFAEAFTIPYELDDDDRLWLLHSGNPAVAKFANDNSMVHDIPLISPEDIVDNTGLLQQLSFCTEMEEQLDRVSGFYGDLDDLEPKWVLSSTNNVAYAREILNTIGGFDENFKGSGLQDLELGYRAFTSGAKFTFSYEAAACHQMHPRNRYNRLVSTFTNWKYFRDKHDRVDVWLWMSWRMLEDINIVEYNDLVRGCRKGEVKALTQVDSLKEKLYCHRKLGPPSKARL